MINILDYKNKPNNTSPYYEMSGNISMHKSLKIQSAGLSGSKPGVSVMDAVTQSSIHSFSQSFFVCD